MNIYRIYDKIKDFPHDIKHWYQRATKGYSYRDLWSIDYWFMDKMPKMLLDFKKNLHGCPSQFTTNDDRTEYQNVEQGMKNWEVVIDRMIFCFTEMNEDTCSQKNEFEDEYHRQLHTKDYFEPCDKNNEGKKLFRWVHGDVEPELEANYWKRQRELEDYRDVMKNEGLDLFKKYFWNLWD
jgi:hypothetical protein